MRGASSAGMGPRAGARGDGLSRDALQRRSGEWVASLRNALPFPNNAKNEPHECSPG